MRISNKISTLFGIRFWLLSLAGALMFLVMWTQLCEINDRFPSTSFQLPVRIPRKGPDYPPILAYWIFGSKGDSKRILRLLKAVYHPRNQYLLHLDATSSDQEMTALALSVHLEKVFRVFGNVNVVGKRYQIDPMGVSSLAAMIHAGALLLKLDRNWDWFTTLSTSDYPLFSQDDILYALKFLPRDLNFVHYKNSNTWKKRHNAGRIVVDSNLYLKEKSDILYAVETREIPEAFQIFGGSPWMMLSRALIEHCVNGWDNLPRKLLMYLTNSLFPLESYFHTILCNTPEFQNTTINTDLRYIVKDIAIEVEHGALNMSSYDEWSTRAIFARPLRENDPMMLVIDRFILKRPQEKLVLGARCKHEGVNISTSSENTYGDLCSTWENIDIIKEGIQGIKLRKFFSQLATNPKVCTEMK
ncbi:beta-glucuronosyltransferase 14C-like [Olea europaea subsp. europaea]|uniref:Beta-glucuronosyltransferase 14C-like n=1 Tax=Olea europaea subsp. europaea TaxID=158383 RepID=A0A8S0PVS8_OLEEU|nr:beta-glucuronosyltransferase 14C-like [Olea europaea subsp. europaea]